MANSNKDPHGNAPERSKVAIIVIDVINDFDFPEAKELLHYAQPMARRIAELKIRAQKERVPVIYVNDNFGRWQSDFKAQVEYCLQQPGQGREIVELLRPDNEDYFVLKPKHSGFHSSTLDVLLDYLGAETLILTGIAANICVLFTANDAYMRDYKLIVPCDCVASNTEDDTANAVQQMKKILKAIVDPVEKISLKSS